MNTYIHTYTVIIGFEEELKHCQLVEVKPTNYKNVDYYKRQKQLEKEQERERARALAEGEEDDTDDDNDNEEGDDGRTKED